MLPSRMNGFSLRETLYLVLWSARKIGRGTTKTLVKQRLGAPSARDFRPPPEPQ